MITNDPKPTNSFMQRLLSTWQSGVRGKIIIGVGSIIAVCFACICITSILPSNPSASPTFDAVALQTDTVETVLAGQTANAPTNTLAPTDTPAPTDTSVPTFTSTPLPQPIVLTGTGDSVVDFSKWDGPAILHVTHNGGGNFVLWNNDASGNHIDLLINTIGSYQGTLPLDFLDIEQTTRFEVNAGGTWEIQVLPFAMVRKENIPGIIQGVGDEVIAFTGAASPDLLKADASGASGNFVVFTFGDSGRDLALNEIAPYTGTVAAARGTYVIVITATGPWSIEVTTK